MTASKTHEAETEATGIEGESGVYAMLAQLPERAMLTKQGLATALGCDAHTIRRMEDVYLLPPSIRIGNKRFWFAGLVLDWFSESSEYAAAKAAVPRDDKRQRKEALWTLNYDIDYIDVCRDQ